MSKIKIKSRPMFNLTWKKLELYTITGTLHKFKFSDRKYSYYIKSLNSIFILWHKRSPFCKDTKFFGKESSPKSVSLNICRKYDKLKDCNNLWNALHCLICYMFRFIKKFRFHFAFFESNISYSTQVAQLPIFFVLIDK